MRCFIERRGQGRPLVFVHGWGFTGSIWDEFIEEFTQEHEVFVVDLPGCGRSPSGSEYHSLADLAASIVDGVPAGAPWIGWSFGGLVALEAATRRPESVAAVGLIASNPKFTADDDWPWGVPRDFLNAMRAGLTSDPAESLKRFTLLLAQRAVNARSFTRKLRNHTQAVTAPGALMEGLKLLASTDLRPALSRMEVPVLAILGDRDPLIPVRVADPLMRLTPRLRAHVIAGAGHVPFISHRHETRRVLREFLDANKLSGRLSAR